MKFVLDLGEQEHHTVEVESTGAMGINRVRVDNTLLRETRPLPFSRDIYSFEIGNEEVQRIAIKTERSLVGDRILIYVNQRLHKVLETAE